MTDRISLRCPQRQIVGNESGLSRSFLVRGTKKAPDCLMGHAILCSNLAEGFLMLTDTAQHVRPFFRWDAIMRPTWPWMLLCGDDRGKTDQQLLKRKQSVIELAVRGHKVNQHR